MRHTILMNKKRILWILSAWVFFFTGSEAFSGQVATVKNVAGEVRVIRAGNSLKEIRYGGRLVPKSEELKIFKNDRVVTGKYGVALLRFYDGSTVWVDSSSVLQLENLDLGRIQGQKYDVQFNMLVGRIRVQVPQVRSINKKFQVHTPKGTASVRGTEKLITFSRNTGTRVYVLEGKVKLSDASDSFQKPQILSNNQEGRVGNSLQTENSDRIDFQYGSLEAVQAPLNLGFDFESSPEDSILVYRKGKGGPIVIESPIGDTPQVILKDYPEYWNLNWWVSHIPSFYVLSKQENPQGKTIQIKVCHNLKQESGCKFFAEFHEGESEYKTFQNNYMSQ